MSNLKYNCSLYTLLSPSYFFLFYLINCQERFKFYLNWDCRFCLWCSERDGHGAVLLAPLFVGVVLDYIVGVKRTGEKSWRCADQQSFSKWAQILIILKRADFTFFFFTLFLTKQSLGYLVSTWQSNQRRHYSILGSKNKN